MDEKMEDLAHSLEESFSQPTDSLMDDIDPAERREHNREAMEKLRRELLPVSADPPVDT